jgi:hypothetical protein
MTTIARTGRPADHRVTLQQIGRMTLLSMGARDIVHDDPHGLLMLRIGNPRVVRKAIVVLNGSDMYDVEIGRMHRRTLEWITEATATDVYCDQLADTLLTLHGQAVTR